MPESDKPPFGGYEPPPPTPPPPTPLIFAGLSLLFELATVIVLLLDRCSLATILAILALIFGGATVYLMSTRSGSDKPPFGGPEPPPRG
ncbi:MAG TPA: hypothetical protein VFR31_18120 [Thermoanaerobaculia bacterium]|nr:hypothetical protein [Thermoanaerobaculia bacterium]